MLKTIKQLENAIMNLKNILLFLLLSIFQLTGCKTDAKSPKLTSNHELEYNQSKDLYTEVSNINRTSDYDSDKTIHKLELKYNDLDIKVAYINEKAYIQISRKGHINIDWQNIFINFYIDTDYKLTENDIHLLLKENSTSKGYLLFPSFAEETRSYFFYGFSSDSLVFLGDYEYSSAERGEFIFDEAAHNLYSISDEKYTLKKRKTNLSQDNSSSKKDIAQIKSEYDKSEISSGAQGVSETSYPNSTWAVNCPGELTELSIHNAEGFLSLYSPNAIYINLSVEKLSDPKEYILKFASVSSQKDYYDDMLKITEQDISKDKPIGRLVLKDDGNAELQWIGLYSKKKQKLEFVGDDFLLIKEGGGKNPVQLQKCD